LLEVVNINGEDFILDEIETIKVNGVDCKCELFSIHKKKLIRELEKDSNVVYEHDASAKSSDLIIDCSGVERALLPKIKKDIIIHCSQAKVLRKEFHEPKIETNVGIGYSWSFPIGPYFHIGYGSLTIEKEQNNHFNTVCCCEAKQRLTSPHYSKPFYINEKKIVGCGEAIGTVSPLSGAGIIPSLECALILKKRLYNLSLYEREVEIRFNWALKERKILDKLLNNKRPSLLDYFIIRKNAKMFGIELNNEILINIFKRMIL